jgi:hypothetical protein
MAPLAQLVVHKTLVHERFRASRRDRAEGEGQMTDLGYKTFDELLALLKAPGPKYCSWDGDPSLWTPGEAWAFIDGAWKPVNSAVVGMEAALMSKAAFDRKFGSLPPLPDSSRSG